MMEQDWQKSQPFKMERQSVALLEMNDTNNENKEAFKKAEELYTAVVTLQLKLLISLHMSVMS